MTTVSSVLTSHNLPPIVLFMIPNNDTLFPLGSLMSVKATVLWMHEVITVKPGEQKFGITTTSTNCPSGTESKGCSNSIATHDYTTISRLRSKQVHQLEGSRADTLYQPSLNVIIFIQCYPMLSIYNPYNPYTFYDFNGYMMVCCSLFVKGEFFMVSAICSPICRDPQLSLDLLPPPAACVDQNYGWFRRILQNSKCSKCRINRNSQFWVKYG